MDVKEEILKQLNEAKDIVEELRKDYDKLMEILVDLVDSDDCDLDHHGNCQTHGWIINDGGRTECPQKRLKEFLNKETK